MSDTTNIFEENPDMDTVGGRISRAREAAGMSVRQLAWRLGITIATVRGWESDRSQPSAHRLASLAGLLKVSLSWILHGVGIGPSDALEDDMAGEDMSAQIDRLRMLHVETGLLLEKLKGDLHRMASTR